MLVGAWMQGSTIFLSACKRYKTNNKEGTLTKLAETTSNIKFHLIEKINQMSKLKTTTS